VTYWHWGTEGDLDRERRTAAQFRERFPNVEVEVVLHGQDFHEQIAAAFSGGAPPDVHALDMQVVQAWGKHNVLVDLRAHLKPDKTLNLASFEQAPMAKLALQLMSYREQVLGLPGEAEPNVYVYNADLFRAAGLKTPHELWKEDRWTWEAFTDSVVKLVRRRGDGWRVAGTTAGLHRLWMNTAGGKEFDDVKAPKRCLYDDAGSVEGLALAGDLRHRYRVTPLNFSREVGLNETDAFVAGQVAMVARWTSGVGVFKGIGGFKWGMVPYPKKKGYAVDYATSGPAIAKDSKVRAAAWEWLKFRQGSEGKAELERRAQLRAAARGRPGQDPRRADQPGAEQGLAQRGGGGGHGEAHRRRRERLPQGPPAVGASGGGPAPGTPGEGRPGGAPAAARAWPQRISWPVSA
jgi:multiple sugar transport system substrate-binding protein